MEDETVIDTRTDREVLLSIESQLTVFLAEVRPLLAAGSDMAEKLAAGGPQGILSLIMGR